MSIDKKCCHGGILEAHDGEGNMYRICGECEAIEKKNLRSELTALSTRLAEAEAKPGPLSVLVKIQKYPHLWSWRPCATCREISHMVGTNFGCYLHPKQHEHLVFASPSSHPSRRELEQKVIEAAKRWRDGHSGNKMLKREDDLAFLIDDLVALEKRGEGR